MVRGFYAIGHTTGCGGSGAGKHPWSNGERGFEHGALDALESQEACVDQYGRPGGSRRWAVTLNDVVVVDLDGPRAVRAFVRIARHVGDERILGVARTPRGWHIYLDAPGWNQRALNRYMRTWLGNWHGTDPTKITHGGLLLDVRTGPNRYVVWPEESGEANRRWATGEEIRQTLIWARAQMRPSLLVEDGAAAPWNLPMTPELRAEIEQIGSYTPKPDGVTPTGQVIGGIDGAVRELERWCGKLAAAPANSGRNNMLNKITYFAGTKAVAAGVPESQVRERLRLAARSSGLGEAEIETTINSGLSSGMAALAS